MKTTVKLFIVSCLLLLSVVEVAAKEDNCNFWNGTFVLVFGNDFYLTEDQDGLNDREPDGYPIYRVSATGFDECKILNGNQDRITKRLPNFNGLKADDIIWSDRNHEQFNHEMNGPQGEIIPRLNKEFVSIFPEFKRLIERIEIAGFFTYPNKK